MVMVVGAASFRHIVDVDGQLHGIERRVVDSGALLALAGHPADRRLFRVRGDVEFELERGRPLALSEDEVAFFRSSPDRRVRDLPLAA